MFEVQIKNLVILGGPSAAGKSSLISKIQQDQVQSLCSLLSIHQEPKPIFIDMEKLQQQANNQTINQLVLHYDFLHQLLPGPDFKYLSEIVGNSETVSTLTICIPPKISAKRQNSRIRNTINSLMSKPTPLLLRRLVVQTRKKLFFRKESSTLMLYKSWFAFLEEHGISNNLILAHADLDTCTSVSYNWETAEKMLCNQ